MKLSKAVVRAGLAAVALFVASQSVQAQFQTTTGGAAVPSVTQAVVRPVAVPMQTTFAPRPYWGNNLSPYGVTPYGSYGRGAALSGAADVFNAQGQYQISSAQAKIVQEQARQAKLDTQRRVFDEYMYEKSRMPTFEDMREQNKSRDLRRSRNTPSDPEVWSGAALNSIMSAIVRNEAELGGLRGPEIPLDPAIVKKLNVTDGRTAGSSSLIGSDKPLDWPLSLQKDAFQKPRDEIDANLPKAVDVVRQGGSKNPYLVKVLDSLKSLRIMLEQQIESLSPNEYITGNRYVKELSDSVEILKKPGSGNYFNGKWQAKGNTIDEVLYNMSREGLRFAPAAPGDEAAYTATYTAIVAYDMGLSKLAGRR